MPARLFFPTTTTTTIPQVPQCLYGGLASCRASHARLFSFYNYNYDLSSALPVVERPMPALFETQQLRSLKCLSVYTGDLPVVERPMPSFFLLQLRSPTTTSRSFTAIPQYPYRNSVSYRIVLCGTLISPATFVYKDILLYRLINHVASSSSLHPSLSSPSPLFFLARAPDMTAYKHIRDRLFQKNPQSSVPS
jgi:hypothetical protein